MNYKELLENIDKGLYEDTINNNVLAIRLLNNCDGGLYVYNRHEDSFETYTPSNIPALSIYQIYKDTSSVIKLLDTEVKTFKLYEEKPKELDVEDMVGSGMMTFTAPDACNEFDIYEDGRIKELDEDTLDDEDEDEDEEDSALRHIEDLYIDLEMQLDGCQGCCDNVDYLLEQLNEYSKAIKCLGGDVERDHKEYINRYYNRADKEKEEQTKKEELMKHRFDNISFIKYLPVTEKSKEDLLFDLRDKVNEILKHIRCE